MTTALDIAFTATLGKVRPGDTWTCVQLPDSATIFGTRATNSPSPRPSASNSARPTATTSKSTSPNA